MYIIIYFPNTLDSEKKKIILHNSVHEVKSWYAHLNLSDNGSSFSEKKKKKKKTILFKVDVEMYIFFWLHKRKETILCRLIT